MFWFDKHHPNTLYIDNREEERGLCPERPNFCVKPDMIMDFRDLSQFGEKRFKLIVWDPPHIRNLGKNSIMRKKFGDLNAETWKYDLGKGFDELWRVLAVYGVLIFKWNTEDLELKQVLGCFKEKPLFGHTTGSKSKTYWMAFMKNPKEGGK